MILGGVDVLIKVFIGFVIDNVLIKEVSGFVVIGLGVVFIIIILNILIKYLTKDYINYGIGYKFIIEIVIFIKGFFFIGFF